MNGNSSNVKKYFMFEKVFFYKRCNLYSFTLSIFKIVPELADARNLSKIDPFTFSLFGVDQGVVPNLQSQPFQNSFSMF